MNALQLASLIDNEVIIYSDCQPEKTPFQAKATMADIFKNIWNKACEEQKRLQYADGQLPANYVKPEFNIESI
jgi:hypothetical protein